MRRKLRNQKFQESKSNSFFSTIDEEKRERQKFFILFIFKSRRKNNLFFYKFKKKEYDLKMKYCFFVFFCSRPKKVICCNCQKEVVTSNELIKCKQKGCAKKYHKTCVSRTILETKFICPGHLCFQCGTTTTTQCSVCKIAFCQGKFLQNYSFI